MNTWLWEILHCHIYWPQLIGSQIYKLARHMLPSYGYFCFFIEVIQLNISDCGITGYFLFFYLSFILKINFKIVFKCETIAECRPRQIWHNIKYKNNFVGFCSHLWKYGCIVMAKICQMVLWLNIAIDQVCDIKLKVLNWDQLQVILMCFWFSGSLSDVFRLFSERQFSAVKNKN